LWYNFINHYFHFIFFDYRVEEIPKNEMELNENELLVPVNHFSKEVYSTFGTPFLIKIVHVCYKYLYKCNAWLIFIIFWF